jgi:hypothetical protein
MRQLLGTSLSQAQRKEVEEMIREALEKLSEPTIEAIGFKYEPVSDFEE